MTFGAPASSTMIDETLSFTPSPRDGVSRTQVILAPWKPPCSQRCTFSALGTRTELSASFPIPRDEPSYRPTVNDLLEPWKFPSLKRVTIGWGLSTESVMIFFLLAGVP